ncbi:hypothetical protein [Marilutibacter maris]|uniref:Uncharacterized protein n=1 Tax=Marilutibacter maris TaxID=1605891 RepID=A0A2U9TI64_9GAMM|nr:hypothetical protein [Lysobacter maris]AWV07790.1 hypothetical protein C9I47_2107 [Lysobacter maris]KAB8198597.1 hypothetical protein FKV24_001035 [Lysobacter maris]
MTDLLIPTILATSSLPMFAIAFRVGSGDLHWLNGLDARRLRDPQRVAARMARLLALVGVALLLGAAGMYWAGEQQSRLALVTIALLVAVNGLGVALLVAVRRARHDYLPPQGHDPGNGDDPS